MTNLVVEEEKITDADMKYLCTAIIFWNPALVKINQSRK
jgi:hypothetical protein